MADAKKTESTTNAGKPAAAGKTHTVAELKTALAQLEEKESGKRKNTVIYRIIAFILWALAAVAMFCPQISDSLDNLPFGAVRMLFLDNVLECVIDIVVAGILCVIAARLWIKANHIHPTKSHNKFVQFVWNQLGVIMAGIIFAPLAVVLIVNRKDIPQKTKTIVAAVLALVFVGASAGSADYHPVTQDGVNEIIQEAEEYGYTGGDVWWTKYGHCYHIYKDCQSLRHSTDFNSGEIQEACDANRVRLCEFCKKIYTDANGGELPEGGKVSDTDIPVVENTENTETADEPVETTDGAEGIGDEGAGD